MRHAVLLLVFLASTAHADDKPKGHLVDPWARMPHPRDGMKLPDPRKAAEKATADGVVAPTAPPSEPAEPREPVEPTPRPPIIATPAVLDEQTYVPPPAARVTTLSVAEPPAVAPHEGMTLEANAGFGVIYAANRNRVVSTPGGAGGLDLGIGGWLSQEAALTLRIAGSSTVTSAGTAVDSFIGPALQIWANPHMWFGFGFGIAGLGVDTTQGHVSLSGPGLDLRLGHTIYEKGQHTLNGSLEATPGFLKDANNRITAASVSLLIGWQYL